MVAGSVPVVRLMVWVPSVPVIVNAAPVPAPVPSETFEEVSVPPRVESPLVAAATKASVAICVVLFPGLAVGAVGVPVSAGLVANTVLPLPVAVQPDKT